MQCNEKRVQCNAKENAMPCNTMKYNTMQCKRECNARALPTWPRLVAPSSTAPGRGVGLRATLQCDVVHVVLELHTSYDVMQCTI